MLEVAYVVFKYFFKPLLLITSNNNARFSKFSFASPEARHYDGSWRMSCWNRGVTRPDKDKDADEGWDEELDEE